MDASSLTTEPRAPRSLSVAAIPAARARDIGLIVFVLAAETLAVIVSPWPGWDREFDAGAAALIAVPIVAMWWRRSYPVVLTLVGCLSSLMWELLQYQGGTRLVALVGLFAVGLYEPSRRRSLVIALSVATLGTLLSLLGGLLDRSPTIQDPIVGFTVPAVVWFFADRTRNRNDYLRLLEERAERLEREKGAEAERAVADERVRIARELHDVVAHRVSMMTIQANAARLVAASDPDSAASSMRSVTDAGKEAMAELRCLVDVLRPEQGGQLNAPQPGLADIEALTTEVLDAGIEVSFHEFGDSRSLPTTVELSIFRIIQEALTNVIKHAGSEATVEIELHHSADEMKVTINDDGRGGDTDSNPGHGLMGMRERVALFGGDIDAGPRPGGGFRVVATIPTGEAKR